MEKVKIWFGPTKNKLIAAVVAVCLVVASGFGVWSVVQAKEKLQVLEPIKIQHVFEYSKDAVEESEIKELIAKTNGFDKNNFFEIENFDSTHFDRSTVSFQLSEENFKTLTAKKADKTFKEFDWKEVLGMRTGQETLKANHIKIQGHDFVGEVEFEYMVIDTQAPVFKDPNKDMEFTTKDTISITPSVAEDPVDGVVEVKTEGDIKHGTVGVYEITETATDKNGNQSTNTFKVTINDEKQTANVGGEIASNGVSSSNSESEGTSTGGSSDNGSSGGGSQTDGGGGGSSEGTPEPSKPDPKPEVPDNSNELDWNTVDVSEEFLVKGTDIGACHAVAKTYVNNGYNGQRVGGYYCIAVMTIGWEQWGYQIILDDDNGNPLNLK